MFVWRPNRTMHGKRVVCTLLLALVTFKSVDSAMSPEQMEKVARSMRNSCLQKIDTTEELVLGMRRGEFPDDPNLECYTNCIMKALRTFKNGGIDVPMLLKQVDAGMPPEIAPRIKATIRKCGKEEYDADPCKMTYQYVQCNYNNDPEIFFFP